MTDLVSLDCYKQYRGINSPDKDGKFQNLISQTSALIENYCNRKFSDYYNSPYKTEWFDGKSNSVRLSEFPVVSIISVFTSSNGGITQTVFPVAALNSTGYFVDLEEGMLHTSKSNINFIDTYDTPFRSLEVVYQAGYGEENIPQDLQLATMDLVTYYEEQQSKPSQSFLGGSRENPQPYIANSFPPHIRRILDLYRVIE